MTYARAYPGTQPSQLPAIRDWIVENLEPGAVLRQAIDQEGRDRAKRGLSPCTEAHLELDGLKTAKLFWVPDAERDIIVGASIEMPDDLVLTRETIPYPSGFAVLESGFNGIDAETGEQMTYETKAMRWAPLVILNNDGTPLGGGMSLSSWVWSADLYDAEMWLPLGRTDWAFGQPWQEYFDEDAFTLASVHEDRARFMALWGLMNTQEPMVYMPTRAEHRRDARIATPSLDRMIHVVRWDPKRYERELDDHVDSLGYTRRVHVRYHVDGFWRRQSYGPRHSLRKWKYIPGHWRGPEDAPVKGETITINKVVAP